MYNPKVKTRDALYDKLVLLTNQTLLSQICIHQDGRVVHTLNNKATNCQLLMHRHPHFIHANFYLFLF